MAEPAGPSGISQARTRLGRTRWRTCIGPSSRRWRSRGRPGRSVRGAKATGAFPQLRLVGLLATGTHVLCGAQFGAHHTGELTLAAPERTARGGLAGRTPGDLLKLMHVRWVVERFYQGLVRARARTTTPTE